MRLVLFLALGALACTGAIERGGAPPSDDVPPRGGAGGARAPGVTAPPDTSPSTPSGLLPLQRLTREQYSNTIRDLLGVGSRPGDSFGPDAVGGSGFLEPGIVALEGARQYWNAAEDLAAQATGPGSALVACDGRPEEACATSLIRDLVRRAYRRPLTAAEVAAYEALYRQQRTEVKHDHRNAVRVLLTAMLQSPHFLYRPELGMPTGSGRMVRLDGHQIASRLSYFLWNTMPDADLFAAADTGKLRTDAEVEAAARRLLGDPRTKETLESFRQQWMHVEGLPVAVKDGSVWKDWNAGVAAALQAEGRRFFEEVLVGGDGKLSTLLLSPVGFVDKRLAPLYEVPAVTSTDATRVTLDAGRRAGLLTHAGFLAMHATATESHPVKRGHVIAQRLLCREIPPPSVEVPPPKPPAPNLSTRERYAEHGKAACAQACHAEFDPLGFAFEHYDAVGRYRIDDGGKPVDASGTVRLDGSPRAFRNALELSRVLAESEEVRRCVVKQLARFALGRADTAEDQPSLEAAAARFARAGGDLRELVIALTTTPAFLTRAALPEENSR